MSRPLRIAQVAPPFERVPPQAYGGTERIVHGLVTELDRRGREITTFASGDSVVPGRHIETVPEALRPIGYTGDSLPYFQQTVQQVLAHVDEFDIIHSHLEWISLLLARVSPIPVVSTFHGRLDLPWADALLVDPPRGLVAISKNQASTHPDLPWAGIVYNGLRLSDSPFGRRRTDALCFVGRVAPEKGIVDAIEVAKAAGRPLRIAAKVAAGGVERDVLRRGLRASAQGGGQQRRVSRRDLPGGSGPAVRREPCRPHAGVVARAIRARRHRGTGVWHAGDRTTQWCPAGDRARRHRWLPRGRRDGDGLQGRPGRRPGPRGDPRIGHRSILRRADDRRLRGDLPIDARERGGRSPPTSDAMSGNGAHETTEEPEPVVAR